MQLNLIDFKIAVNISETGNFGPKLFIVRIKTAEEGYKSCMMR